MNLENTKTKKLEQTIISEFSESNGQLEIFIDNREINEIAILLEKYGIKVNRKQLEVGDILISNRIAIERKTASDFEASIIDNRLFEQASKMTESYEIPIVVVEGEMKANRIHQNAFIGAYLSLITDYRISVINTKNLKETAEYIYLLAKREQKKEKRGVRLIAKTKATTPEEKRLRVLESFPSIGPKTAKKIMEEYGSLERFFDSDIKELEKAIGKAKAREVYEIIHKEISESLE